MSCFGVGRSVRDGFEQFGDEKGECRMRMMQAAWRVALGWGARGGARRIAVLAAARAPL